MKKIDIVIGNPPFNSSNTTAAAAIPTTLYEQFVYLAIASGADVVSMVIPSTWMFKPSSFKNFMFGGGLKYIKLGVEDHFDINMPTCYFAHHDKHKGKTAIIDSCGNRDSFNLDKSFIMCTDSKAISIINNTKSKYNLGELWVRGLATRTTAHEHRPTDGVSLVLSVGKNEIITVSSAVESTGRAGYKVGVASIHGDTKKLGKLNIFEPNHVCGKSVVFIADNFTLEEANNMKAYLESAFVRFLVMSIKASSANSKYIFSHIPKVNLSKRLSDTEIFKLFNISSSDVKYIMERTSGN